MLIRDILEESARKHADIMAVKWLAKKEIRERSYRHLAENIAMVRKGLLAEGFREKHIALIGASSVEWIESYLGIITGRNVAVPLDANLPGEDLVDLIHVSAGSYQFGFFRTHLPMFAPHGDNVYLVAEIKKHEIGRASCRERV